jgi:hypothetical protein
VNEVQLALRDRFSHIHPLMFIRSVERSKSDSELFDILDTMPKQYPVVWNDDQRRWVHDTDLFQTEEFVKENT